MARYKTRIREVEAILWVGEENCEEVFAFLDEPHPEDETDHSQLWFNGGYSYAENGMYLVRDGAALYAMFASDFEAEFEPAE